MTAIKKLIDGSGNQYFPQTHTNAVVDGNGYTVESRMQAIQDVVNQAQMAQGDVPSDLTPTEDSTNWVTSGGVYNALTELEGEIDEKTIVKEEITLALKDGWAAATTWVVNTNYTRHAVIPSDSIGDGISIKAHATNGSRYGFLPSYPSTITNGDTVEWCNGTERGSIAAGETLTIMKTDFPDDCQYIYIGVASTTSTVVNNNYLPQAVILLSYSKNAISDIKSKIVSIEDEITVIDTSINIIADQTAIKGWPGSNPGWVSDSDNYKGYFITVNAGDNYRIKANAERNTKVYMLPDSSHTNGSVPNKLANYKIAANTIDDVKVPSGATCMWVSALYDGNNTSPQYIYAAQSIKDAVYKCEERITPLEDVLAETEVEARVLKAYTSSRYIMADSSDADYGNVIDYSNADYACTPFIDISGYNKFSVKTLSSSNQKKAGTVVYDANKVPIAGYYQSRSSGSGSYTAEGTLPGNAAYIRVSSWSSSFSNGSVVLHLWDTLKEFTVRKAADLENRVSELEATGVPAGATMYDYVGEKIVIDLPKYTGNSILTMSLTGTGQGGAVFGDYYFVGTGGNAYINVINLSTKTKLTAISLEAVDITNAHANTLAFSNQYYTDGDAFPILYICSGYALDGNTKMYGYRIVNENNAWSATLVHTITLAASTWTEGVIDNSRQKLWIKKSGGWYCVDMPQYSNGDTTIDLSIATPEFSFPLYEGSAQGHLFYNDKIYFASGTSSESAKDLYVLNTKTGKYDSIVDLHSVSGNNEPENVFVYDGYLHVGYRNTVFRLYFN